MKKIFVTLVWMCVTLGVWAADVPKQGFGVQVGWAQPILRVNSPGNPSNAKDSLTQHIKMNGFKVGVVYDGSFLKGFGSSIGINYTFAMHNGGWQAENMYNDYPKSRNLITYHAIELFVDWQYKFEIAKETYVMLYSGPTIQCGLLFDMRKDRKLEDLYTGEITTVIGNRNSAFTTQENDEALKRLNITWGVGAGFQYKRYFVRGSYDFGLINPYKNIDFENGNHTRGRLDQWSVKIGAYLWYND